MAEKVLGFAKRASGEWHTEQALVASNDLLHYVTENLPKTGPDLIPDIGPDQEFQKRSFFGNITKNEGTTEHTDRFEKQLHEIMAFVFGDDTAAVVDGVNSPNAYDHTFDMLFGNDLIKYLWGTLVLDENTDGHDINVYPSARPKGFNLDIDMAGGNPQKMVVDWIISYLLSGGQSTTNQAAQIAAAALDTSVRPVMPWMNTFRIERVTGSEGVLASPDDVVKVSKIAIGIKRTLVSQFCSDDSVAATVPRATYEPEHEGYDELTLSVTFKKQDTQTKEFLDQLARINVTDPTQFKADLVQVSDVIANPGDTAEVPFRRTWNWPNLELQNDIAAQLTQPNLNEVVANFKMLGVDSAPSGMTVTKPCELIVRDDQSAAYA